MSIRQTSSTASEDALSKKINLNVIQVSIRSKVVYDEILSKFSKLKQKQEDTYGTGLIKFTGNSWVSQSVFLGFCEGLNSGVLRFVGQDSLETFNEFRNTFINVAENKEKLTHLSISVIEGSFTLELFPDITTKESLTGLFEKTISSQKQKVPKIQMVKEDLYIGSKSTGNYMCISGTTKQGQLTQNFSFNVKLSPSFEKNTVLNLLVTNVNLTVQDVFAFLIVKKLSKTTLAELIYYVKDFLTRNHAVSSISEVGSTDPAYLSASGKTVSRSLTAVKNKLIKQDSSRAAQLILREWLLDLKKTEASKILEGDAFIQSLTLIFNSKEGSAKPPKSS